MALTLPSTSRAHPALGPVVAVLGGRGGRLGGAGLAAPRRSPRRRPNSLRPPRQRGQSRLRRLLVSYHHRTWGSKGRALLDSVLRSLRSSASKLRGWCWSGTRSWCWSGTRSWCRVWTRARVWGSCWASCCAVCRRSAGRWRRSWRRIWSAGDRRSRRCCERSRRAWTDSATASNGPHSSHNSSPLPLRWVSWPGYAIGQGGRPKRSDNSRTLV